MTRISPTVRVSLGLILVVVSIIILSDILGLLPDRSTAIIEGRKSMAESLAVQYSLAATRNDYDTIKSSMRILVDKDEAVLSAALRRADGRRIAIAGNHIEHWPELADDESTPTHIQVPIYKNSLTNRKWGTVELRFRPVSSSTLMGYPVAPLLLMIGFVGLTGFAAFMVITRIIFRTLDPSAVIPVRVKNALDGFIEGVLITDDNNRIILANQAFSEYVNSSIKDLIGKDASGFAWMCTVGDGEFPWERSSRLKQSQLRQQVYLMMGDGEQKSFMVNSTVIKDDSDIVRGIMTTFDDISQLEAKNSELELTLHKLSLSREKVISKNKELQVLAARDPLTGCLNRRTLFDIFENSAAAARKKNEHLCCIMADIDHFKPVNDQYGHSKGDEVIRMVADTLRSCTRKNDEIFRYGGEEFCIIIPGANIEAARATAERARAAIAACPMNGNSPGITFTVTASFGVSTIKDGATDLQRLIDQADKALYVSKNTGRNRVSCWNEDVESEAAERSSQSMSGSFRLHTGYSGHAKQISTTRHDFTATSSLAPSAAIPDNTSSLINDSLTGLPNRMYFRKMLSEAIANCHSNNRHIAVILLDIDMFKRINNALGYTAGDNLLREIASRLGHTLRNSDSIARLDGNNSSLYGLGGDEFGILLTGLDTTDSVGSIVERIINSISSPIIHGSHEIHLTCSSGISLFPSDGNDPDTLLTHASLSLEQAKRNGHNSYQFYDANYSVKIQKDFELENELRHAVERNELELYFQPKVDIATMKITSMESLLRWNHPDKGIIPPNDFIPVAENSGLITSIGQWVLHAACAQAKIWHDAGYGLTVAVNLSAVQFRQKDLLDRILHATHSEGALPEYIELEITESTIMENISTTATAMDELHTAGYTISIDDFGTGYSSLEHLKRFPISTVKIDRSFVNDITSSPDDAAIVTAIVAMAHSMGLMVVAEGVETHEQLAFLQHLNCDELQGYLFSPPLPAAEATRLLGPAPAASGDNKKIAQAG
jgi:diguanylate cyclase (GGDEF)-like protein